MDAADFDSFYAGTCAGVLRQMFFITGDLPEAEDVVHEAYERAWLRWDSVRASDSPEAWVRTVARRLAVSRWRRARNAARAWQQRGGSDSGPPPDGSHVDLVAALRTLPEKQRVAIVLHHLADLSVYDVAEETGASVSAVKQQLARGRAALEACLKDDDAGVSPLAGEAR
jgi:RNA polymerase sigma-70 factor (ECF subfamily)